jgi:hypothetical protein
MTTAPMTRSTTEAIIDSRPRMMRVSADVLLQEEDDRAMTIREPMSGQR